TVLNLLALLLAGAAGFAVARQASLLSAHIALCFIAIGFLVTLVSYFQMRLVEREKLERLEYDELTKAPSASALFNKEETSGLPARRSREQFEKYFVPGFTIALCFGYAAGAFLLWRARPVVPVTQPILALVIFSIIALVLFML